MLNPNRHLESPLVGAVVRYKGDFHVIVEECGQSVKIMAPHHGNVKLQVKRANIVETGHFMTRINYKGKSVLCSRKGTLISLVSKRLLKNTTPDGRAMLACAFQ